MGKKYNMLKELGQYQPHQRPLLCNYTLKTVHLLLLCEICNQNRKTLTGIFNLVGCRFFVCLLKLATKGYQKVDSSCMRSTDLVLLALYTNIPTTTAMETTKSPAKTPVLVLMCRNPPSFEATK